MLPHVTLGLDMRIEDPSIANVRKFIKEWKQISTFTMCDYYPLTPYSSSDDAWMAWQFDNPQAKAGVVQVFRREKSDVSNMTIKFKGLNSAAKYMVSDIDKGNIGVISGAKLMSGLEITLNQPRSSAVIMYKAAK